MANQQSPQRQSPPSRHSIQRPSLLSGSQAPVVPNPMFNHASSSTRANAPISTSFSNPMYRSQPVPSTVAYQELASSTYYPSQPTLQTMMAPAECGYSSIQEAHQQFARLAPSTSYNQALNSQSHESEEEQDVPTLAAQQNLPIPATTPAVAVQGKQRIKLGDLVLPDTIADPTRSQVNLGSTNLRDARRAIANRDLGWTPVANDQSLPTTDLQREQYAKQLFLAITHYGSILDKKADTKRCRPGYYGASEIEKVCYEIVDVAEKLHTVGPISLSIYDSDTLKSIAKESHFTFKERMDCLAMMFTFIKNRCDAVMKGTMLEELVAQPRLKLTQSLANLYQNENKAEDQKVGRTIKAAKAAAPLAKSSVAGQQVRSQPEQQLPAPATRSKGGHKKTNSLPFVDPPSAITNCSPVSFAAAGSSKKALAIQGNSVNVTQPVRAELVSNTTQEQHRVCFNNFEAGLKSHETSSRNVQQPAFSNNVEAYNSSLYGVTGNLQNVYPGTNYNIGASGSQLQSNGFGAGLSNTIPANQVEEFNFDLDSIMAPNFYAPDPFFDINDPALNSQYSAQVNPSNPWDPAVASTAPLDPAFASWCPPSPPVQDASVGYNATTIGTYSTLPAPIPAAPKRKRRSSDDAEEYEHVDMPTPKSKRRYRGPL